MKKFNNKKGFTIVELVIVIAVIGILAGVLIPTFSGIVQRANNSATTQELTNALKVVLAGNATSGALAENTTFVLSQKGSDDKYTAKSYAIYNGNKFGEVKTDVETLKNENYNQIIVKCDKDGKLDTNALNAIGMLFGSAAATTTDNKKISVGAKTFDAITNTDLSDGTFVLVPAASGSTESSSESVSESNNQ